MRRWLVTPWFGLVLSLATGCGVGEVPPVGGTSDAANVSDVSSALCVERVSPAAAHVHEVGGGTNAGQGCQNAGCHVAGGAGPTFLFSGTLYKPGGALEPVGGAEIRVVPDAGGDPLTAKTDDAGNFYSAAVATPFPATTLASGCPTADAHMVGKLNDATGGNCNAAGCHASNSLPMTLADQ